RQWPRACAARVAPPTRPGATARRRPGRPPPERRRLLPPRSRRERRLGPRPLRPPARRPPAPNATAPGPPRTSPGRNRSRATRPPQTRCTCPIPAAGRTGASAAAPPRLRLPAVNGGHRVDRDALPRADEAQLFRRRRFHVDRRRRYLQRFADAAHHVGDVGCEL